MNLEELFTSKFLFYIDRVMLRREDKAFLLIGGILVVLAVIFKLAAVYAPSPVDGKYRQKFYNLFLTIGLSEVVWFGARYYFIRFFGSHFVALLVLLIGLVWFVWLAVKMFRHYREEKQQWEKEQVKLKYLPK